MSDTVGAPVADPAPALVQVELAPSVESTSQASADVGSAAFEAVDTAETPVVLEPHVSKYEINKV